MWGVVPAAGRGSRIQPLAFSKELLPVGSRSDKGFDRPCAVSEYLIERLILGGADKICFVISPGKSDILEYYGDRYGSAELAYVVQPQASGLCDAVFRASTVVGNHEDVLVGLPDTVWFPKDALSSLPDADLSFLLFPVEHPEFFDAVVLDGDLVREIQVKQDLGCLQDVRQWLPRLASALEATRLPGRIFRNAGEWIYQGRRTRRRHQ